MKVLLEAYTRLNFGDDLFIYTIINRYPDIDFYLITDYGGYDQFLKSNKNLHIINSETKDKFPLNMLEYGTVINSNMELKVELLKRVDATIVVGGSMFIQSEMWREWQIDYYDHLLYFSRWSPVFFMGCNFGPYYSEDYYIEFKRIFSKANDICFREKKSYDMFKELPNVRYSTDIAFSLKNSIGNIFDIQKNNKLLGISVISLKDRKELQNFEDIYLNKIKNIIDTYYKKRLLFCYFSLLHF